MLTLSIKSIFKARGIDKPYSFLVKAGFSNHTATYILNHHVKEVQLRHLEILCRELHCTPNDILIWRPDSNNVVSGDHPLNTLNRGSSVFDLKETMKSIPISQLNEIVGILKKQNTGQVE